MVNNSLTLIRGDTFVFPIELTFGTKFDPEYFYMSDDDKLYVGIREYNSLFDDSIVRKVYTTKSDEYDNGVVNFTLHPKDSELLITGTYYLCAKLFIPANTINNPSDTDVVRTVLKDTLFYIVD